MRMLASGIRLEDGMTAPATAAFVNDRRSGHSADVRLTLHEGRNRQIRRMFDALNLKVVSLKRERYGILDLTGLHPGESRRVKPHEVKALYQLVNGESRRAKPLRDSRNKTR
jgi:23S rRNA pseudouridine2605 synthase